MTIWWQVAGTKFRFYDTAVAYARSLGLRKIAVAWVPA